MPPSPVVAVVGGGMAGLSAALELLAGGASPLVLEASDQVGGKLRVSDVGGQPVDEGADSMLRRVSHGVELAERAGLDLISPAAAGAGIWTRGRIRDLPTGTVMGVPADLAALRRAGVLSAAELTRAASDLVRPGEVVEHDLTVGELVARRLGRAVVDRLVDPLLGGVYAGHAALLSAQATLPQLWPHLARHHSLIAAARAARGTPDGGPVFAGLVGGLGRLPAVLAEGLDVRTGATVRSLERTEGGWRVHGTGLEPLEVAAVVIALPAAPAARVLAGHAKTEQLAGVGYASVGIVTLVLDGPSPGRGTGYLVPAVEGRVTKAVTFTSRKWDLSGAAVIRASVGRFGEERDLQRDDGELVQTVLGELEAALGPLPRLVDSRVTRWGGALPQYAVGHLDLVRRLRDSLPPGVAVAGAAYDGVGVPAVIASGQQAARAVLAGLAGLVAKPQG